MGEKRFQKRLEIGLDAICRVVDTEEILKDIRVVNINHSGLCFISYEKHLPEQVIEFDIALGRGAQALLQVKVVWCAETQEGTYRSGVKVINADAEDLKRFQEFYELNLLYPPNNL